MNSPSDYKFDLSGWTKHIRMEPVECFSASGYVVSGPQAIIAKELVRSIAGELGDLGESVPCDVFAFVEGEPSERAVTKIGGLPYRSAILPWPVWKDAIPMTFVCQFWLRDSIELFGSWRIPGDVLLVFAHLPSDPWDSSSFYFEWQQFNSGTLISESQLPMIQHEFGLRYFGLRHRSVDFLNPAKADPLIERALRSLEPDPTSIVCGPIRVWNGTKIGGVRVYIPHEAAEEGDLRQLCCLGEIGAEPMIGDPRSFKLSTGDEPTICKTCDGFFLTIFLDEMGEVRADFTLC